MLKCLFIFIGAVKNLSVKQAIKTIKPSQWKAKKLNKDKEGYREIAETIHTMSKTKTSFRLIIQRHKKINRPKGVIESQPSLFEDDPVFYHYHVIATNSTLSAEDVIAFYNKRGQEENLNKEVKYGVGMNKMPCGDFDANKVWFRLGIMAYNLLLILKQIGLPDSWKRKTAKTLRWNFFQIASKFICVARQKTLRLFGINTDQIDIFRTFQQRLLNFRRLRFSSA